MPVEDGSHAVDESGGSLLWTLLDVYVVLLLAGSTVTLILLGRGWGPLPHVAVRLFHSLLDRYAPEMPPSVDVHGTLRRQESAESFKSSKSTTNLVLEEVQSEADRCYEKMDGKGFATAPLAVVDMSTELITDGIEAIIEGNSLLVCDRAPIPRWNLLTVPPKEIATPALYVAYAVALVFRLFVLLPIRVSLCIVALQWVTGVALLSLVVKYTKRQRLYICVVFARLTNASMGLVAKYVDRQNRPKPPGIAVANHLTATDIQVIFADLGVCPVGDNPDSVGYTVTGQIHRGPLGYVGKATSRIATALLLDRSDPEQRKNFQKRVIQAARDPKADPILLFPEGYCINNTAVLRFRKAAFEEGVDFYPIALKQDVRLGDAFWAEDGFLRYMLRLFTSWATVYEVRYLPRIRRSAYESSSDLAERVQRAVADAADLPVLSMDGGVLKRHTDRMRKRARRQAEVAAQLLNESIAVCKMVSVASADSLASMVALQ